MENGEIAGLVTPQEVRKVERQKWPFTTIRDVMRPLDELHSVAADASLLSTLELMSPSI